MDWTDIQEIAIALTEVHPEVAPLSVRFTDLHRWICALPGFQGIPDRANERVLEAIQMAWLEESE